jgi:hypothetical protein
MMSSLYTPLCHSVFLARSLAVPAVSISLSISHSLSPLKHPPHRICRANAEAGGRHTGRRLRSAGPAVRSACAHKPSSTSAHARGFSGGHSRPVGWRRGGRRRVGAGGGHAGGVGRMAAVTSTEFDWLTTMHPSHCLSLLHAFSLSLSLSHLFLSPLPLSLSFFLSIVVCHMSQSDVTYLCRLSYQSAVTFAIHSRLC